MNGSLSPRLVVRPLFAVCLLVAGWLPGSAPARAVQPVVPVAVASVASASLFADGWGVSKISSGSGTRSRIIQISIVCLCLGLFILMRK